MMVQVKTRRAHSACARRTAGLERRSMLTHGNFGGNARMAFVHDRKMQLAKEKVKTRIAVR